MIKPQAGRQQALKPHGTRARLGKREPLGILSLRVMRGSDDVHHPITHRRNHRLAVFFRSQGGGKAEKCAIFANIIFIQGKVIYRNTGGNRQPLRFSVRHCFNRLRGGELRRMIARAGQGGKTQITLQRDHLCLADNAGQAQPTRQ